MSVSNRLGVENRGTLVSIGNYTLPRGVSSFSYVYQDLSDSEAGRGLDGTMWKGVYGCVRKFNVQIKAGRPDLIRNVLAEMKLKNSLTIEFFDWESGAYQTVNVYAGDREVNVVYFWNNHELAGLKFTLTEVAPYTS